MNAQARVFDLVLNRSLRDMPVLEAKWWRARFFAAVEFYGKEREEEFLAELRQATDAAESDPWRLLEAVEAKIHSDLDAYRPLMQRARRSPRFREALDLVCAMEEAEPGSVERAIERHERRKRVARRRPRR